MRRVPVKSDTRLAEERARARARDIEVEKLPEEWRERAGGATDKGEQVDYIIDALRAGVYHRGRTTKAMMRLWSLSKGAVVEREVEALRAVHRAIEDHADELAAELFLRIQSIGQGALERVEDVIDKDGCRHEVRKPDHRTALAAAVELAELAGLRKTRVEVDVRGMSDEQLYAQLREHGVEVRVIEAKGESA